MVNLRFHIVSITAVFLALAIGIVMGSTLLQRATVDSLKSRQSSLEQKIDDRVAENNSFRSELGMTEERDAEFEADPMPVLTEDLIDGEPVVIAAVRGIDEGQVAALEADLTQAGAAVAGVLWLPDALDTSDDARRLRIAEVLDAPEIRDDADAARVAVVDRLAALLRGDGTGAPGTAADDRRAVLAALDGEGLVEWEPAEGGDAVLDGAEPPPRVVVISGEGAVLPPEDLAVPLASAVSAREDGAAVAVEIMDPRSRVGEIERRTAGAEPGRGAFVDLIRTDDDLAARIVTVDNGDRTFGRLAVVLVVARGPGSVGHYGETDTAERSFPPET